MPNTSIKTPISYQVGDGLIETSYQDADNKIVLSAGITKDDIRLEIIGDDLYIKFKDSDQIKLINYAAAGSSNHPKNMEIEFNDGSILNDISNIPVTILGTNGADKLLSPLGLGFTDKIINGGDGNDQISAIGTIMGGIGNDKIVLTGGSGGSNIIYNLDDGFDTVDGFYNINDKITFGADIDPSEVAFREVGASLFIQINGVDCIQLQGYFLKNNRNEHPRIEFKEAPGTVWESIKIDNNSNELIVNRQKVVVERNENNKVEYLDKTNLNNVIIAQDRAGQATDNIYHLGDGNNQITDIYGYNEIYAGAGNDTIIGVGIISGGKGDDRITLGGAGYVGSTLLFNLGDGQDTVLNSTSRDKILFGAGIVPSMVSLVASGKDLIIQINEQDQITIASYFTNRGPVGWLDTIEFYNNTVWTGLGNIQSTNGSAAFNESAEPAQFTNPAQLENQLNSFISSMASFAPETSSSSILPSNTYDPNSIVLAANAV